MSATIEVTRRCPMKCVHCYNDLPMDDGETRQRELSYEEHCRILDQITDAGCLWLLYTGGEILARTDFLDIYRYAKRKGLLITLFTNGTLITPQIAGHLAQWPPFSIEITIYGRTAQTHDQITRVPGSFDRCMQAVRLLMERHLPLTLKTIAITVNKHELWEMKHFVENDLGLTFRFDAMINCRIDCSKAPLAVRLSPQEVVELDLLDSRRLAEWKRFSGQFTGPVHPPGKSDEMFHCGGGVHSFAIDPYGQMSLCGFSQTDTYNLRTGTFAEGWTGSVARVRAKKATRQTKCVTCEIKATCGMCPVMAELENGDAETPVDFLCQVAHLRAYAFGLDIPPHGECEYCKQGAGYEDLVRNLAVPICA